MSISLAITTPSVLVASVLSSLTSTMMPRQLLKKQMGPSSKAARLKLFLLAKAGKDLMKWGEEIDGEEEGPAPQGTGEDLEGKLHIAALLQGTAGETDQSQVQGNSNIQVFKSTF
ncbi:unnamed protein product [Blepharisma stoltei]|uniref:Uncharacterized protein n=1 Tax=Blepharisma stoltei TaxID=1481888 RepID=A0AAU9JWL8_9CILI|nr:unnamed protein product [Blepharisma stoltei]